ncbi:13243_t:CDS:2, partial [Acaulospora colombiana]
EIEIQENKRQFHESSENSSATVKERREFVSVGSGLPSKIILLVENEATETGKTGKGEERQGGGDSGVTNKNTKGEAKGHKAGDVPFSSGPQPRTQNCSAILFQPGQQPLPGSSAQQPLGAQMEQPQLTQLLGQLQSVPPAGTIQNLTSEQNMVATVQQQFPEIVHESTGQNQQFGGVQDPSQLTSEVQASQVVQTQGQLTPAVGQQQPYVPQVGMQPNISLISSVAIPVTGVVPISNVPANEISSETSSKYFNTRSQAAKVRTSRLNEEVTPHSPTENEEGASVTIQTSTETVTKNLSSKKIIRTNASVIHKPPSSWEDVYQSIREYRKTLIAPVDVMGCERLAEEPSEQITPQTSRFQSLIALMLSSQTKDQVTAAAIHDLRQKLPGGLTLKSVLQVDEDFLDQCISKVGFHRKKAK